MTHPWSCTSRRGFSLVELVVAIAIIAVLASLVIPAAGRARDQAKVVSCRARLHNLGVALMLYANDNEGALPVSTQVDGPHGVLLRALDGRYVQQRENFYCPSERTAERRFSRENFEAGRIGYFYYSCQRGSTNRDVSGFLRYDVSWPRELRTGMDASTWVLSDSWFRGEETAHRYYWKGVNYLTVGGAVEMVESSPRSAFK